MKHSRFANRKTISLSNRELIDAMLSDRKAVTGQNGYLIDDILMWNANPLFLDKKKHLAVIIKENYLNKDAVTLILRGVLHDLEVSADVGDTVSPTAHAVFSIIEKLAEGSTLDVEAFADPASKENLLMYFKHYLYSINENPKISNMVRTNMQAVWFADAQISMSTVNEFILKSWLSRLAYDTIFPGMAIYQMRLMAVISDCLIFANTPKNRLAIVESILFAGGTRARGLQAVYIGCPGAKAGGERIAI